MLGLYIHIPFCNQICPYCDFYKMVVSNKTKQVVIKALLEEMKLKNLNNYSFNSVYIGGGTPSSLDINLLEKLLKELKQYIELSKLNEFTIEVNPNDITTELVKILKKYHITRVSIGVQTFNKKLQQIIKRPFNINELEQRINLLREYNITNINLDLIYAIPTESLNDVKNDLDIAIKLNPNHLSIYSLILEEHTIFYHEYLKGNLKLINENTEAKMYKLVCSYLKSNGYEHYETSNFSKTGYESIHNLIYWNCDEYIGIGPAAASYYQNYRTTNHNNLNKYLDYVNNENKTYLEHTFITKDEAMQEFVMLGLRKIKGISKTEFYNRFNINIIDRFPNIISLIKEGSIIEEGDCLYIKEDLFYISNHFIAKIIY